MTFTAALFLLMVIVYYLWRLVSVKYIYWYVSHENNCIKYNFLVLDTVNAV